MYDALVLPSRAKHALRRGPKVGTLTGLVLLKQRTAIVQKGGGSTRQARAAPRALCCAPSAAPSPAPPPCRVGERSRRGQRGS